MTNLPPVKDLPIRNIRGYLPDFRCLFVALTLGAAALDAFAAAAPTCRPERFGGQPDDDRPDTVALQAAISSCAGRDGIVLVGAGEWRIGGLMLGSDMVLRLEAGATLRLIPDIALYPAIGAGGAGSSPHYAALFAPFAENLRIEGPGTIDGSGPEFWDENFYELGIPRPTLPRPAPAIELVDCWDVVIDGLKMVNLPGYAIRFHRCENGLARDVYIRNDLRSPNTDGIQIRDSADIRVQRADIRTGDDAVVLKSGARAVERIVVEDSRLVSDDAAIKFGTGSHVGVRDSTFRQNVIEGTRYGIAIFAIDGGVHERNVFEDTTIATGGRHSRTYPLFVDVDRREPDRPWGGVLGLTFRNLEIESGGASLIAGNPNGRLNDVRIENVRVVRRGEPEDLQRRASKPRGNVNIRTQAESVDYSTRDAEIVIAHARDVYLDALVVPGCDELGSRRSLELIDVELDPSGDDLSTAVDCR